MLRITGSLSRLLAAAAAAVLLGRAATARCADVQVNPVRVALSSTARSEIVALRNVGAEPAAFEMQVRAWNQDPSGEMKLSETEDVVVFPLVVSLAPGEERNVRVGAAVGSGLVEKTYRLFIQEMPPPVKPGAESQVRVLSRIGIPVFLQPARAVRRAAVEKLAVREGKASFSIVNSGTVHVRPTAVKLALHDGQGKALGNREAAAWYVLAGGETAYDVVLRGEGCAAVREVRVAVTLDTRQVLQATVATPDGVCAP